MCRRNSSQCSIDFVARYDDEDDFYADGLDESVCSSHEKLPLLSQNDFKKTMEDVRDVNVDIPKKISKVKEKAVAKSKSVLF